MVQRIGTHQRKTRHKLTLDHRERGKISVIRYFQKFQPGESVAIKLNPQVQKGRCFPRFHGRIAKVISQRGRCYELSITDGNKEKMLLVYPIHLKKIN